MLLPPDPELKLSPRTRRLVQRVAMLTAAGCLLGLVALRLGGTTALF
ncbi:MAG TPA: hypothetical protein VLS96_07430 [Nodosilinea sp.]|nr:hypothetical protein [Nodosilinea sp.]